MKQPQHGRAHAGHGEGSIVGPVPIREFIIKIVGPCNLACDYCYVYSGPDKSVLIRPRVIAMETVDNAGRRMAEHAAAHGLDRVRVVLHGGEPLLAGTDVLESMVQCLRAVLEPVADADFSMQTNAVLLDTTALEFCRRNTIRVGVSLDGTKAQHDRHRRHHDGRSSHLATTRALHRLRAEYRDVFGGILSVIDVDNDPIEVYEALLEFDPPRIDVLLPHGHWSSPPPQWHDAAPTSYAFYLVRLFDRWFGAAHRETDVRLFDEIIHLLLGGQSSSDQVGLSPAAFVVIDTDGSLQQVDILKVTYPGAPETGLNVRDHPIDAVLEHPAIRVRQQGIDALSDTCQRCAIVSVCGGGHYSHRYRQDNGFVNPSVYCHDLQALIDHIARRLSTLATPT